VAAGRAGPKWNPGEVRLISFRDPAGGQRVGELLGERVRVLRAPSMRDWLTGEGRDPSGDELDASDLELLAPVPDPPSVRDFYAFERHVAAGWRRRGGEIPEHWYAAPAFYFSNPASILGPGEPLSKPAETQMLDFELEIAAVIGSDGGLAGFTLMNDWSARDVQAREMTVGLGPHKAKDFGTSLGPWLVTPDELPYREGRLELEAAVTVNGREVARASAAEQHFPWPEIVAAAARGTRLRPADVLGSGTLAGGCLLELGPQDFGDGRGERWLEPGDIVELQAEGLGSLPTPIA
jgi:fumarylacetoacetate (FAA) hydrolase